MWILWAILFTFVEAGAAVGLFLWMRRKKVPYNSKRYTIMGIVVGVLLFVTWALSYSLG